MLLMDEGGKEIIVKKQLIETMSFGSCCFCFLTHDLLNCDGIILLYIVNMCCSHCLI